MLRSYNDRQPSSNRPTPSVARLCRPNPRVPIDPEIEAAAREVHAALVADPSVIGLEMFPLVTIASPIVRRRLPTPTGEVRAEALAEVVETVLANPAARLALAQAGFHVG